MNTHRASWIKQRVLMLLWIAVTAGIAFLVARNVTTDDETTDLTAPVPPVTTERRSTLTLTEQTIAPVVSGDGTVVRDADDNRWLLVAPATSAEVAYQLLDPPISVQALIDGGPAGFDCAWAGLGQASGGEAMPSSREVAPTHGSVTMRCKIPNDVRVIAGLTGTMVLTMQEPTDALALPVTTVVGSEGQGQVVVVHDDGSTSVRNVELGISDTFWIEITGGLEKNEQVLEFPTQVDFGQRAR